MRALHWMPLRKIVLEKSPVPLTGVLQGSEARGLPAVISPTGPIGSEPVQAEPVAPPVVLENGARVQMSVGVEPAQRAVIIVGPALGLHSDDCRGVASVLGREAVRLNADFLNRVGIRREVGHASARIPVGGGAIHLEVV